MAFPQGVYFRSTDNQTDPTNYDAEITGLLDSNYPTSSAQGNTIGWEGILHDKVDRDVTADVRLKGVHYGALTDINDYRIDLPATGVYIIRAAMGDSGFPHPNRLRIVDTTTVVVDNDAGDVSSDQFADATGVIRTSESDWVNNNASIQVGFSTTICRFRFGGSTGTSDPNWTVNAIYIEAAAGGAAQTFLLNPPRLDGVGHGGIFPGSRIPRTG